MISPEKRNSKTFIFIKGIIYNLDYFTKDYKTLRLEKAEEEELREWIEKLTKLIFYKPYLFTDTERQVLHMKISGFSIKEIKDDFPNIRSVYEALDNASYSIFQELNR